MAKKSKKSAKKKSKPKASKKAAKKTAAKNVGKSAKAAGPKPVVNVAPVFVPVAGSGEQFQVRRVYCIGRNYAAHAREMGSDPDREPPFFFLKPADAIQVVMPGKVANHPYPPLTKNYQYEVELVAALKSGGKNIKAADALQHVYGYAVGLDMTRRDLQIFMREQKKPWDLGKSADFGAPIGPIHKASQTGHFLNGPISLSVNGETKQTSDLTHMIWSVAEQIEKLSEAFELKAGDLIYSGTPENVGPVQKGDLLVCKIKGLPDMSIKIV